jgi:hypothetical protein
MTADEFVIFTKYIKEEFGANDGQLAKAMGFARQTINLWKRTGCPPYADLIAAAIVEGLDPWKPGPEHQPNPALRQAEQEPQHSTHVEA